MPKIGMELGMTCKVGENWIKTTINVSEIDTDLSISEQLILTKKGITDIYDLLVGELEEKIMNQVNTSEQIKKKK